MGPDDARPEHQAVRAGEAALLEQLDTQLTTLALDAPAAALKAVDAVDRLAKDVGRLAARTVEADTPEQLEALGTALGIAPTEAGPRVTRFRLEL